MKQFAASFSLALGVIASPAIADITPSEAWQSIKESMTKFGYEFSFSESRNGDTLSVTDAAVQMELPEEGGTMSMTIPDMDFTDLGDGTVAFDLPQGAGMDVVIDTQDGSVEIGLAADYENLVMIISGVPGDLLYTYTADALAMSLADLKVEGEDIPQDAARLDVQASSIAGTSSMTDSDGATAMAQSLSIEDVTYNLSFTEPGSDNMASFAGTAADVAMNAEGVYPLAMNVADMAMSITQGMASKSEISHKGGQLEFTITDSGKNTTGQTSTDSATILVEMGANGMMFSGKSSETTLSMQAAEFPLPINAEIGQSEFTMKMPLLASDDPQEARLTFTLGDFSVPDLLWNIFDPGSVLPRDPATVSFDLSAMVTPFYSLIDPEEMAELEKSGELPGELNTVTLRSLIVEAAGGKITGDGAFTFDNSDLESFDGMPRPEGKLSLQVSGANGLIDNLIAMGLLSSEDAMGARMMMSMFTVPGDAPDTASSTIEVNEQGHILANGQRIK